MEAFPLQESDFGSSEDYFYIMQSIMIRSARLRGSVQHFACNIIARNRVMKMRLRLTFETDASCSSNDCRERARFLTKSAQHTMQPSMDAELCTKPSSQLCSLDGRRHKKRVAQKREQSQGTRRQGEHEVEQEFETHQSCKLLLDGSHRFIEHGNSLNTKESARGETVHL